MVITSVKKEEQAMLGRTIITAKASFEGRTPKRDDIRKELAKVAKVNEEGLIIKSIQTHYGGLNANITAEFYEKDDNAKALVHKKLLEKHTKKEEVLSSSDKEKVEEAEEKKEEVKTEEPTVSEEKKEE